MEETLESLRKKLEEAYKEIEMLKDHVDCHSKNHDTCLDLLEEEQRKVEQLSPPSGNCVTEWLHTYDKNTRYEIIVLLLVTAIFSVQIYKWCSV